jgi:SAM-dependent methyltransferase
MRDVWAQGESYEPYVGRWSRLTAREFLAWLSPASGLDWLDVGCGTGALSHTILEHVSPERLLGIDRSAGYISLARRGFTSSRARFAVGDAQALPVPERRFDVAVSALVLNFVPEPERMIREMVRTVRPGGQVALYVWDYAAGMELMRHFWDAAQELDPAARDLDEARRFPICRPEVLRALFERSGIRSVTVRAIDVPTIFRNFDDYWSPFLEGQGPAPGYAVSLDESKRQQLRERIRGRLPTSDDGSIALMARAWAVRGVS